MAEAGSDRGLVELVEAVRSIPHGRPKERGVEGMLREGRGSCSAKHLYLAEELRLRFPETEPQIVHRVYWLARTRAEELYGPEVAAAVPSGGLGDVHRYLTATVGGARIEIDVTFSGRAWDGRSSLPPICGPGRDYPTGEDPDTEKRELEIRHCNPTVHEAFIAALSGESG